ncbi:MAG: GNAT family N-acetyltransferase [Deltaproteobacteria bacterium]|nr:GNAT family N-acetyltransferase [Deltaproteobacteria bacterium]
MRSLVGPTMAPLRSLCFRTDLFLARCAGGEVIERERYVVLRTPGNPDYWWGNFLLHHEPPEPAIALDDHARELPGAKHTLVAWDRPDGDRGHVDDFVPYGFHVDEGVILTARAGDLVAPQKVDPRITVAPLVTAEDWEEAVVAQVNAFAPRRSGTLDDLRTFIARQYAAYRAMQEREQGRWWGARIDGQMAGSLGLVRVDDTLGRFQLVGVDPAFGRRGVCSALVHHVARRALFEEGLETLVMAADATYHAAKVYESVGFRRTETLVAALKKPPKA